LERQDFETADGHFEETKKIADQGGIAPQPEVPYNKGMNALGRAKQQRNLGKHPEAEAIEAEAEELLLEALVIDPEFPSSRPVLHDLGRNEEWIEQRLRERAGVASIPAAEGF
jgi:hypothetical protein